jgi:ribosomal protein S19E (S16A)
MPRTISVSIGSERAADVVRHVRGIEGVVSVARNREASLEPPGDVVTIHATNDATRAVLHALREIGVDEAGSIVTSTAGSIISPRAQRALDEESNETTWDEIAFMLRHDTNLRFNYLALMLIAGATAATG